MPKSMDTIAKLKILSDDSRYDLACACGTNDQDRRHRGADGKWLYPVSLPNGGRSVMLKTLLSNSCSNDCKYCPLRHDTDIRRCTLNPDETARIFMEYLNRREIFGLFLSSGVIDSPDHTMERLNAVAAIIRRKHQFRGYIHLKIIPGASDAAIRESLSLASAVSINIETPGEAHCRKLSGRKHFLEDIIRPLKLVARLTARGERFARVKTTTQFVVGASDETDAEIVKYMGGLYERLHMDRVYFSAYQAGLGAPDIPGEAKLRSNFARLGGAFGEAWAEPCDLSSEAIRAKEEAAGAADPAARLMREHRLYQADFLIRRYGFKAGDIPFDANKNLSLDKDPKERWAEQHPEFYPVNVNRAQREELLRVPGLGPLTVSRLLDQRRQGRFTELTQLHGLNLHGSRLKKAMAYVRFD